MNALTHEIAERTQAILRLQTQAGREATERMRIREVWRRKNRRIQLMHMREIRLRVRTAYEGVKNLKQLGRSDGIQSFILAQQCPVLLWNQSTNHSIRGSAWGQIFNLGLSSTGIFLNDYIWQGRKESVSGDNPIQLFFPYDREDNFLEGQELLRIATPQPFDWEYFELEQNTRNPNPPSTELLFEILVECAETTGLERFGARALSLSHR